MNQIQTPMALTALKMSLGSLGRADFLTESSFWPGDLIYPDEQISIFVLNCFWYRCPHDFPDDMVWTPATKKRIDRNLMTLRKVTKNLKKVGWMVHHVYECEIKQNPTEKANEVMALLESRRGHTGRTIAQKGQVELAHLARMDAGSRVSDTAWRAFIRWMSGMFTNNLVQHSTKWECEQYFTKKEKWTKAAFAEIWECARHHEVIGPTGGRPTKKGALFDACLVDCGFVGKREREEK